MFVHAVLLLSVLASTVSAQPAALKAYTPSRATCADGFSLVRSVGSDPSTQTLSSGEQQYVQSRKANVIPDAWKSYLAAVQGVKGIMPLPNYVSDILTNGDVSTQPTFAIASSGGSYRASIFGAGVLNALDGRNETATAIGTGGLLQAATYLSGLSGGSWFTISLAQANFPTMRTLIFGQGGSSNSTNNHTDSSWSGWNANINVLEPSSNTTITDAFLIQLVEEVSGKRSAGFPITFNDVWARALARHFVNGTNEVNFFDNSTHGAGLLFSDLVNIPTIQSFEQPFLIITSDSVATNQNTSAIIPGDAAPITNPIYEYNMFEMGSWDPVLGAFIETKFLGTSNISTCVTGYDQLAFVAGTSSMLFNELNVTGAGGLFNSTIGPFAKLLNASLPEASNVELDVGMVPNPFHGTANGTFIDTDSEFLKLVDGGEDGEVIPIQPLLVHARGIDTLLAIDATNDENGFAAGSSLIASAKRAKLFPSAYSFPPVPTSNTSFIAQGLNARPTFFGCNSSSPTPLVIYLANGAPPPGQPAVTNTSTNQLAYAPAQIDAMLDQTFQIATQGDPSVGASINANVDPNWPACLACAVVDRARNRTGTARSGVCETCFVTYCWDGSETTTTTGNGTTGGSGSTSKSGSSGVAAGSWTFAVAAVLSAVLSVL